MIFFVCDCRFIQLTEKYLESIIHLRCGLPTFDNSGFSKIIFNIIFVSKTNGFHTKIKLNKPKLFNVSNLQKCKDFFILRKLTYLFKVFRKISN